MREKRSILHFILLFLVERFQKYSKVFKNIGIFRELT